MDDQAVEEIAQDLVAAFHVVGMVFVPEQSAEFTFRNPEIDESEDVDDVGVLEFECDAEFLEDIVVGHEKIK